ncbi:hypothetical protein [Candidatus Methylacidithermus pantelleriae]|uniref:Resolvase/invertase-type recombinase catalytic domain-containing protein n=1 Tax=Candidatus Methylacidithermus pantelleriae TaxID=2744239 RepID=A0A8J2BS27_9BACT|nr:hypothetical protein [Candidatus Methylacidithermus pantelleriae]CAF0695797.1 hypothetical protein MPNT_20015 [Candidatus Methylacidithermus pantelleriae]
MIRTLAVILVEEPDRLMRFGFQYREVALAVQSPSILGGDSNERTEDIVADLRGVIVSLCGRLYGKRSAQKHREKGHKAIA